MIRSPVPLLGLLLGLAFAVSGCSREPGAPRIQIGEPCATCGMAVREVRFAALLRGESGDRQYDSIECLVQDMASRGSEVFLADYDQGALHAAESVWVVKGDFPTPMGGGLAAFVSLESAREVAAQTHGRVLRLSELAPEAAR